MSSSRNSLFHESSSFKAQFTQFLANIGTYTIYVFPQENNFFPVTYYAVKKVYIVRYYKADKWDVYISFAIMLGR